MIGGYRIQQPFLVLRINQHAGFIQQLRQFMHGRVINADKNNRINILIVGLFLKDLDVRTLLIQSAVTQIDIMRRYRLGNAACHFEVKCITTGGKGAQRGENSNAVDQQPPAGQRIQNPQPARATDNRLTCFIAGV
ncbi:hypothetical protein SDC9_189202 [bioreactor metagenome]|uniref:Uncharacterized protein n=1 Tax=bioreactor metagenome TaxID=1076179 RepID=A0A645HRG6_9ZZZZ